MKLAKILLVFIGFADGSPQGTGGLGTEVVTGMVVGMAPDPAGKFAKQVLDTATGLSNGLSLKAPGP